VKLLLWHWGRRGGGARYTLELARTLAPRCSLQLSLSRQSELFEETVGLGLPGWHVDTYRGPVSAALSITRLPVLRARFAEYLDRERFDAVIATMHHIWCPAFIGPIRNSGAKLIFAIHDAEAHPGDLSLGWDFMLKREVEGSDGLVALSQHVARRLQERYLIPGERLWVLPHPAFGFASAPSSPRRHPGSSRPFRLVFFGRIKAYKGLGLLLDAMKRLPAGHAVELTIAGQGSLEPYAAQLAALRSVHIVNRWIGEDEVGTVLAGGDLLVAPYIEASQSGVIPSAYGAGLPVIATPVGGLCEQVVDGETGLIAEAPSAAALAGAIARLMSEPALYERCAAGALNAAQEALSWDKVAAGYLAAAEAVTHPLLPAPLDSPIPLTSNQAGARS
jgi:glycosyltransferase involved in cell wall biosynthesis